MRATNRIAKYVMSRWYRVVLCICLFFVVNSVQCKRRLKILMIVTKFPYSLQTFIINQIEGLIERGHDLYILAEKM